MRRAITGVFLILMASISLAAPVGEDDRDGKGTIPVLVSVLTDPNGIVIELNQMRVDQPQADETDE